MSNTNYQRLLEDELVLVNSELERMAENQPSQDVTTNIDNAMDEDYAISDSTVHSDSILQNLQTRKGLVEDALKRLKKDKYGVCQNCGKKISPERLKIIPYTPYCIDCQNLLER
jgi:DnaK suppressor protein